MWLKPLARYRPVTPRWTAFKDFGSWNSISIPVQILGFCVADENADRMAAASRLPRPATSARHIDLFRIGKRITVRRFC